MSLIGRVRPHRTLRLLARALRSRALWAHAHPRRAQEKILARIVSLYDTTAVGRGLGIDRVRSIDDLKRHTRVTEKKDYAPWLERLQTENPRGLVTKDALKYLALTSGTTEDIRLFPFPNALIRTFRGFQWEIMLHLMHEIDDFSMVDTNILVTTPAAYYETLPSGLVAGKATAIMTQLTPKAAAGLVRPSREILAIHDVETKIRATIEDALPRDIRLLMGVPLCVLPIFERLVTTAKERGLGDDLATVWPNLKAYGYSGATIGSLAPRLRQLVGPRPFFEFYSASESPVAYQFRLTEPGMLLDLRHCFFEFQEAGSALDSRRFTVDEVAPHTPYRILVTTTGGRFAYRLGDVVEFTSTNPFVLRILGREQEELNLGYERIPLHVVRQALERASHAENVQIHNFFVCPTPTADVIPAHEWHIEFAEGGNPRTFSAAIDQALLELHDRYAFARKDDHLLAPPSVVPMRRGAIERFVLETREYGLGKFPPIYNSRGAAAAVLDFTTAN